MCAPGDSLHGRLGPKARLLCSGPGGYTAALAVLLGHVGSKVRSRLVDL